MRQDGEERRGRPRVLFKLSMPSNNAWNGKWSGEGNNYSLVRRVDGDQADRLGRDGRSLHSGDGYWTYSFGDGWVAGVTATLLGHDREEPASDGFCGYEWMVDNIIRWGHPECKHAWVPDANPPREDGEWQRCTRCRRSQLVEA